MVEVDEVGVLGVVEVVVGNGVVGGRSTRSHKVDRSSFFSSFETSAETFATGQRN